MSEVKLVPNYSVVFVQPVEEIDDGVMKGIVNKVAKNGRYYLSYGQTVIYNLNDVLMRFTDQKSGQKMHAIFYYKIIGKYEKVENRKKPEKDDLNKCAFFGGASF